ncbi:PoNe immunity protein domain-containing protein [Cellulophaga fucicola]|uniref:PoNi-like cognate immunity protein n=1 Tax=Cellulophaga fucicola TaxID=76595 RepID=UPI003EC0E8C1
MRDKIKDKAYFETFLEEELDDISFYKEQLNLNNLKEDRIIPVKKQIALKKTDIFYARYSMGESVSSIKCEIKDIIKDLPQFWNSDSGYVQMVWMLSISIMLEVEDTDFNKLVQLVEKDNPDDFLIDFLMNFRDNTWNIKNTSFKFNTPYKALAEVISFAKTDKSKATIRLKQYLDKEWYKGHSDMGWYDSHKSEHNIYSGYWCWEAGALVKSLGLDDSILKDQQYYPYDMVHFKD